jgi:hypothetical protein
METVQSWVASSFDAKNYVIGYHRLPVVPVGISAKREGDGAAIRRHQPVLGQVRRKLARKGVISQHAIEQERRQGTTGLCLGQQWMEGIKVAQATNNYLAPRHWRRWTGR